MNQAKLSVPPRSLLCRLVGATIAGALICSAGCDKEDTIRVYNAPKEAAPAAASPVASAKPIDFSTPRSWVEGEPSTMEYARFKISTDDPKAAVTATMLSSQEGSLLPNVNRWQRQLKLQESPQADLPKLVKDIDLPAGKAQIVDLTGPEAGGAAQRTVAVILPHGPQTWYLKLAGPAPIVETQRSNFDEFLKSVRFPEDGGASANDSSANAPTPPSEDAAPPEKLAKWTAPTGWKAEDMAAGSPRFLGFKVASDDKPGDQAEVSVTRMTIENLDVLRQDVNMWRGQVGLPEIDKLNDVGANKVSLGGNKDGALFDFAGPQADKPDKRVVVAMVLHGGAIWFFKILGPADLVNAQKGGFLSFVQSAEFAPQ